ncbi:GDP-L-fucose synthase [Parvibaculum sp.]|uniref:GDP-L-fucose synthase n=1 Tax=Parvibaculum sp. TaxID=2024848 RepID=UPI0025F0A74A|nr:GDP-L-fucose synthase [Parvibaculum sp.]
MTDGAIYSLRGKKVWIAGHRGMVGAALMRRLASEDCELLTVTRDTVDLRRQAEVESWLAEHRPEAVFIPAARVGGILANDSFPAEFLYDNLMIEANIINAAWQNGVEKLLFLGSSCIYPKMAEQPMREDALLTGPLEPTNQWYAVAKIAGIKLAQAYRRQYGCDFISAMPTNLYGIGDNFDLDSSHVLPALVAKMHAAKEAGDAEVVIWGTGSPKREFLYVDDCADALVFLMTHYSGEEHINVGFGEDLTIQDLAQKVKEAVGFEGELVNDMSKPDGTPRKLMDSARLRDLGWRPRTGLDEGIAKVYRWYLETGGGRRGV